MANADVKAYETGGADLLTALVLYSGDGIPSGTEGPTFAFEVWNGKDAPSTDDATEIMLTLFQRPTGETAWTEPGQASLERWFQFRVVAALGGGSPQSTGWTPTGTNRPFRIARLAGETGVSVELKVVVPGGRDTYTGDVLLAITWGSKAHPGPAGLFNLRGVASGLGDGLASHLVAGGGLEPSSPEDSFVTLEDTCWTFEGRPYVLLEQAIEIDDVASNGALGAGEAYWKALTLAAGMITETNGTKGAAPRPTSERPALPPGEVFLAYVHRDDSGEIDAGDVYADLKYGRLRLTGSGLTWSIGRGDAIVDDFTVSHEEPSSVTFPDNTADLRLYLLPSGGFGLEEGDTLPNARALPLYRLATAAGAVVGSPLDVRSFGCRGVTLRLRFGTLVVNAAQGFTVAAPLYLLLPEPVRVTLDDAGAGTGGQSRFDIEQWTGTWDSIFTSAPGTDRRPSIPFNSATLQATGLPEVVVLLPGERYRVRVDAIPTGGAAPSGAEVVLFTEEA